MIELKPTIGRSLIFEVLTAVVINTYCNLLGSDARCFGISIPAFWRNLCAKLHCTTSQKMYVSCNHV